MSTSGTTKCHLAWENPYAETGVTFHATLSSPAQAMKEAAKIGGAIMVWAGIGLFAVVETGHGRYSQRPPNKEERRRFVATANATEASDEFYRSFHIADRNISVRRPQD